MSHQKDTQEKAEFRRQRIQDLFFEIIETYPSFPSISRVADDIGLPSTNLYKWMNDEAYPRPNSFERAERLMVEFLKKRRPIQAQAELKPVRESLRASETVSEVSADTDSELTEQPININVTVPESFPAVPFVLGLVVGFMACYTITLL